MRLDPANLSLQNSFGQLDHSIPDAEAVEVEIELSDLLLDMCPIKQVSSTTFNHAEFFFTVTYNCL